MNSRSIAAIGRFMLVMLLGGLLILYVPPQSLVARAETVTWTAIDATGPPARWDHTLSSDPVTGSLLLFGGRDAGRAPPLATPGSFRSRNMPGCGHAVAADLENRGLYLFGGPADGATFFNDTWRFDLDRLTWEEIPAGDARPSPRYGTSAVLDGGGHPGLARVHVRGPLRRYLVARSSDRNLE